MPDVSKLEFKALCREMILGLKANFAAGDVLRLNGKPYTRDALVARFEEGVSAVDETMAAERHLSECVERERKARSELSTLRFAVKQLASSRHGDDSAKLTAYGLKPRKPARHTSPGKALAVERRLATRAARHTMGKRQKKKIKGSA